jgi:ribokinase
VLNEHEAAWLAADLTVPPTPESLHAALGVTIVITLGESGLEAATPAGKIRLQAHQVTAVDTTGAGDCFTGVLAAALDRGLALEPALRRANIAAGLCCTIRGTQGSMPTAQAIDAA